MILEGLLELLKYYVKSNRICLKVCLDRGDFRFHSKESKLNRGSPISTGRERTRRTKEKL